MAKYQNGPMHIYASRHFTYALNAKALHHFLFPLEQTDEHFAEWITQRIRHYGFEWNLDFVALELELELELEKDAVTEEPQFEQDLSISLSMAKELARIEGTDRGRDARYYLLECEFELGDKFNERDNANSFDKKLQQLNQLAQAIRVGDDVAIIPTIDLINLIQTIREYQHLAYLYARPNEMQNEDHTPEQSNRLDPKWINDVIDRVKQHTGKSLLDEVL
ncbi:hypothetical protein CBF23_010355 [Marinomonas agarivorans]|nr:hypothetical protein CBF23_010355 [Marinomonas agarivorans]